MAKQTVPPSHSYSQTTINCAYCEDATTIGKRITADSKIYCGKLCAALGLIQSTDVEDGIDPETGVDALKQLVEDSFLDGPVRIPKKVRDRDIGAALSSLPDRVVMVVIDDDGTPDWVPEPNFAAAQEPSQAEIDHVVEALLADGDKPGGRP